MTRQPDPDLVTHAGELPYHLQALLRALFPDRAGALQETYAALAFEDVESALATSQEGENEVAWRKCDLCALAFARFGRKSTGQMAHLLKCTGQQVRRYRRRGLQVETSLRDYTTPHSVYDAALDAGEKYGLPVEELIRYALDNDLTARQVQEVAAQRAGSEEPVTEWREVFYDRQDLAGEDVFADGFCYYYPGWLAQQIEASLTGLLPGQDIQSVRIEVKITGLFAATALAQEEVTDAEAEVEPIPFV